MSTTLSCAAPANAVLKANAPICERPDTPAATAARRENLVTPAVDVVETADAYTVYADMPGIDPATIHVSAEKNVLTIKALPAAGSVEQNIIWREFEPVGYQRSFKLGNRINQDAINAEYKHGVLKVTLPLAAEAKPRSIEVKVVG